MRLHPRSSRATATRPANGERPGERWERPDRDYQTLGLRLRHWHLVVHPSARPGAGSAWTVEFEAQVTTPPLRDLLAYGVIEVFDTAPLPPDLATRWRSPADGVEGWAQLQEDEAELLPPRLDLHLCCHPQAGDTLLRALQIGTQSAHGSVTLRLDIDAPGHVGPDLWVDAWRREPLRVVDWDLQSRARLADAGQPAPVR